MRYHPKWDDISRKEGAVEFEPPGKPRNPDGRLRDAEDLGKIMRDRRVELGVTQVQLAQWCKCSPRFIGELERGVAGGNIKQVIRVCRELGIDLFAKVRGR